MALRAPLGEFFEVGNSEKNPAANADSFEQFFICKLIELAERNFAEEGCGLWPISAMRANHSFSESP
jgi:hypothetical protein